MRQGVHSHCLPAVSTARDSGSQDLLKMLYILTRSASTISAICTTALHYTVMNSTTSLLRLVPDICYQPLVLIGFRRCAETNTVLGSLCPERCAAGSSVIGTPPVRNTGMTGRD